mgnify:CR=1 FL=1
MNKILSYKGLLADGGQDTILLSTKKGEKGYRIKTFRLMPIDPDEDIESTAQLFSIEQSSVTASIDFSNNRLLGAGIIRGGTGVSQPLTEITIFDQIIFNQDIFVTLKGASYARSVNYYLELEVLSLNEMEATVATLKDIRNND